MERVIKFRAFDGVDYMSQPFTIYDVQLSRISVAKDATIMQYTSVLAQDGNEICEGDVIDHDSSPYPCKVIYKKKIAQFMAKELKGDLKVWQISTKKVRRVTGNIYQNAIQSP